MPTLTRFLAVVALICAVIYGVVFSLATFVTPNTAEISERIPLKKLENR